MCGSESTSQMKAVNLKYAWRWPTAVAWTKGGCTLVDASERRSASEVLEEFEDTPRLVSPGRPALQPW